MNSNLKLFKEVAWLFAFATLLLGSNYFYQQHGISAVLVILLLTLTTVTFLMLKRSQRHDKSLSLALKALANNDTSLGINDSAPLAKEIAQVRATFKQSRLVAEAQAQFLKSLLLHIDQAIIVFDNQGNIIDKNPATDKLLGITVRSIKELGEIGLLISSISKDYRTTLSWRSGEIQDTLSVHINCCEIEGRLLKLVSLQSIYHALMAKEQQAYKQLTKVLTHEVANSITPLASLAHTARDLLPQDLVFSEREDKEDMQEALLTLSNRATQLSTFIKSFHQITSLPKPNLAKVELCTVIEHVITLFKTEALSQQTTLCHCYESQSLVNADAAQLEQAIINIVKNALEAVKESPQRSVNLHLYQKETTGGRQQLLLDIEDSGAGIEPHVVEQVFVPFFTTKKQGSGIGLSLSRQIMIQHGGDLTYVDKPNGGGCFRFSFGLL
ncbi:sensor histidine kinase [Thalassotalea ganghwensis]